MFAEVIAIGDELTSGQRLDTNSPWLSQRLGEIGLPVLFHTTVSDNGPAMVDVFRTAIERAYVVVCTGGLGPTADDLTRDALAEVAGVPLVRDERSLEVIRGMFARWKRRMTKSNERQAMFPSGARPIDNPHGTAPGIAMELEPSAPPELEQAATGELERTAPRDRTQYAAASPTEPNQQNRKCLLFAMPGVPAEMKPMWQDHVRPALLAAFPAAKVIRHRRIHCFGAGESRVEEMLPDLIRRGRTPTVGITASGATITLRITAEADTQPACEDLMRPVVATIYDKLGDLVFGEEDDQLEDVVVRKLAERGQTLATLESGSVGLVAHWLSEAVTRAEDREQEDPEKEYPEKGDRGTKAKRGAASFVFRGGFVKHVLDENLAPPMFERLAQRRREQFDADYGLVVGPIVQSAPGEPPRATVSLASPDGVKTHEAPAVGNAELARVRLAKQALNLLRLAL